MEGDAARGILAFLIAVALAFVFAFALNYTARAHEFYEGWSRPTGPYGIVHRGMSCCRNTDCSPVAETRMEGGRYVVRPEGGDAWFKVPPGVIESQQTDPRESPDGRSHVCILAGMVICFVEGNGI
jgi:hypothetical protein